MLGQVPGGTGRVITAAAFTAAALAGVQPALAAAGVPRLRAVQHQTHWPAS